jgi:hypothetical protein
LLIGFFCFIVKICFNNVFVPMLSQLVVYHYQYCSQLLYKLKYKSRFCCNKWWLKSGGRLNFMNFICCNTLFKLEIWGVDLYMRLTYTRVYMVTSMHYTTNPIIYRCIWHGVVASQCSQLTSMLCLAWRIAPGCIVA